MKKISVIILVCGLFLLDLVIKFLVSNYLTTVTVIDNFFSLTYVLNDGAAFSILASQTFIIILITLLCLAFVIYELKKNLNDRVETIAYSLIISGLLGNFVDRLIDGYVIDYLSFKIFNYNYPVFNLADILIVLGVIIMLIKEIGGIIHANRSKRK